MIQKLKMRIRKWLDLKDENHFYALSIKRVGEPNPREKEFQEKIIALSLKYRDVPMFFIQGVHLSWVKNDKFNMLDFPDGPVTLSAFIQGNVFDGRIPTKL